VKLLEKNIQRQPTFWEPHLLLGQAHAQRKDYAKAKETYSRLIQSGAAPAAAYHGLAMALARLGEKDQAGQYLEKFRQLEASEFAIVKKGKVEYNDLQAMMVDTANVLSSAGQLFLARKRPAEAEKLWRRAAASDPAHVKSRQGLAWLCRSSGRIAEAVGFLQQLVEIDRGSVAYLVEIGRLEADMKHFDAAEAALRTACQRAPKEADPHATLAQLYLVTNRNLGEARRLAEKAVELEPTPGPYVVLAAVCERQNDLAAATAAMKRATELDPGNPGYRKAYEWLQEKKQPKK
jgi:tetratricopeptide (TPR) repeat protein